MFDRKAFKKRGKKAVFSNYLICVIAGLIMTFAVSNTTGITLKMPWSAAGNVDQKVQNMSDIISNVTLTSQNQSNPIKGMGSLFGGLSAIIPAGFLMVMASFGLAIGLLWLLLRVFIFSNLEVGCCRFFILNGSGVGHAGDILYGFVSGNYVKILVAQFLKSLYTALWTMLFVIPGIVKGYAYCMTPYILADDPTMSADDAITMSKDMMKGHKMDMFIMDLSFIGWHFLNMLTMGILGLLFVNPYMYASKAEAYQTLRYGGAGYTKAESSRTYAGDYE